MAVLLVVMVSRAQFVTEENRVWVEEKSFKGAAIALSRRVFGVSLKPHMLVIGVERRAARSHTSQVPADVAQARVKRSVNHSNIGGVRSEKRPWSVPAV